ncbi:MAG: protein kinase [Sphingomonas sp.]|jgi:serine/threonine protein kinase|uniref:serine/threonine-protein kinase n=1 Tax=Sphingomonas sp. TaxID=28214 RepID=UPI0035624C8B
MARTYGNWTIVGDRFAEGGQGEIYQITNATGMPPGIWLLKRLKNPRRHERFARELETLQRLKGAANVVQVQEWGISRGETTDYYVMEKGDGSLEDLAPAEGYAPERAFSLFAQILDGAEAVHQVPAVHRDLKPANVILFGNTAKIADTGLALLIDEPRITPTDEAVGPRFYMAPELEHGRNLDVDASADIYSLGKILYWLLSGGVHLPRERHLEAHYRLGRIKAPSLEVFERVFDATLTPQNRRRCKDVASLRNLFDEAVAAYREHPDAALAALLAGPGVSVVEKLAGADSAIGNALFRRVELDLLAATADELMSLMEGDEALIDGKNVGLIDKPGRLSLDQLARAAQLCFSSERAIASLTRLFGVGRELRQAIAETALASDNSGAWQLMAEHWQWWPEDLPLAHELVARFAPPQRLPRKLVKDLSLGGISVDLGDVLVRGIQENPGDDEVVQLAMFGLTRSSDSQAEERLFQALVAVRADPAILQDAMLIAVVHELGAAAWSRFEAHHACPNDVAKMAQMVIEMGVRARERPNEVEGEEDEDA